MLPNEGSLLVAAAHAARHDAFHESFLSTIHGSKCRDRWRSLPD
jgi:hypothetical protein